LLFGNDNLSVEINTFIFSCVQKDIKVTGVSLELTSQHV
jgi:hypothetical protein